MKRTSRILIALLLTTLFAITACDDDGNTSTGNNTNNVNNTNNTNTTNNTNNQTVWNTTITVRLDDTDIPVDLSGIDRATWNSVEAIRLTRVVEQAVLELPWNYHYNFIGNDGYNPLVEKYDGDLAQLPFYGELDSGFLYEDEGGLRIGWEDALGFPGSLGVRGMESGVIELHPFSPDQFLLTGDGTRVLVDVTGYTTVDATDWKDPDAGPIPMVPMTEIFADAPFAAEGMVFKIYGNDGFANNDANLMPYENMTYAYMEPVNKKLIIEEEWDTLECCWRVHDIVVIKGMTE